MQPTFGIDPSLPKRALDIAVITVSDTRTLDSDSSGAYLVTACQAAGHAIRQRKIVRDDVPLIQAAVTECVVGVDVVLITGGTGLARRDVTPEALKPLLERELPGFGETFRRKSEASVGLASLQSRAMAGTIGQTLVFALPGSTGACRDAWEGLIEDLLDSRYRPCSLATLVCRPL